MTQPTPAELADAAQAIARYNAAHYELGIAMCRQWGIDAAHCTAIDISWRPGQLPTATVELLLTEGVVRELLTLSRPPGPPTDRYPSVTDTP